MKKYCSSCGASVGKGLSYCNRCGEKVIETGGDDLRQEAELSYDSLIWAMVAVFIGGLGVIIGLMAVMKRVLDFNDGLILGFTSLSFLMWFIIEGVLISLMWRRRANDDTTDATTGAAILAALRQAQERALPGPLHSVTEHTTRSLETAPQERAPKSESGHLNRR